MRVFPPELCNFLFCFYDFADVRCVLNVLLGVCCYVQCDLCFSCFVDVCVRQKYGARLCACEPKCGHIAYCDCASFCICYVCGLCVAPQYNFCFMFCDPWMCAKLRYLFYAVCAKMGMYCLLWLCVLHRLGVGCGVQL